MKIIEKKMGPVDDELVGGGGGVENPENIEKGLFSQELKKILSELESLKKLATSSELRMKMSELGVRIREDLWVGDMKDLSRVHKLCVYKVYCKLVLLQLDLVVGLNSEDKIIKSQIAPWLDDESISAFASHNVYYFLSAPDEIGLDIKELDAEDVVIRSDLAVFMALVYKLLRPSYAVSLLKMDSLNDHEAEISQLKQINQDDVFATRDQQIEHARTVFIKAREVLEKHKDQLDLDKIIQDLNKTIQELHN